MDDKVLLYSLLFTSIFNLIVLLVLAVAAVRLGSVIAKLASRVSDFLEKGEKEVQSVGSVMRSTFSNSDQFINAAVKLSERYMIYKTINHMAPSRMKSSKLMTVFGVGVGLYQVFSRLNKNKQ